MYDCTDDDSAIKDTEFMTHICLITMKPNAGLKIILVAMDAKTRWEPLQVVIMLCSIAMKSLSDSHHMLATCEC